MSAPAFLDTAGGETRRLAPPVPGPGSAPSESFDGCFVVIVPS